MIGVCAMLLSAPAQAEEEELNQASKKVYEEALTAANKSDWALCRTRAIGVWQQIKSPSVAGILGICEAELGMNRDAAEHLDFFLKNQKKGTPKQLAQVSEAFEKVKPKVARITLTPVPDDADVFLDDKPLGRGKQTFFVNPGDVRVGVAKNGQAKNKTISVKAGEQLDNLVIDVPIDSAAGGQAGVGGATGGTGGAAGQGAAGAGAAGQGAAGQGAGGAGGDVPAEDKPLWPVFLLGGVGLAGIGAGVGLTVAGGGQYSDAEQTAACSPFTLACSNTASEQLDAAALLQNVGIGMFAVGGASLVGMAIYLLIPSASTKAAFTPWVDGERVGLTTTLAF